ncbi:MAG: 50S ribosomal protein L25/general stress protein Ctc [Bacteroidales bacterium]
MKTVSMSGSLRENVGKKDAKKQRREEKVPCVLYGGKEQVHFTLNEKDFKRIIFTPEVYVVNINLNGKEVSAILQDVQYHPVFDHVLHADFLEIVPGKPIKTALPITFEGTAPGVIKGGRLELKLRKLSVQGLVENLPDKIVINIGKLDIGDSIKIKNIVMDNVTFLDSPNTQVVAVKTARAVVSETEEDDEGEEGAAEEPAEGGEENKEAQE